MATGVSSSLAVACVSSLIDFSWFSLLLQRPKACGHFLSLVCEVGPRTEVANCTVQFGCVLAVHESESGLTAPCLTSFGVPKLTKTSITESPLFFAGYFCRMHNYSWLTLTNILRVYQPASQSKTGMVISALPKPTRPD